MRMKKKRAVIPLASLIALSLALPVRPAQALFGGGGGMKFSYPSPTQASNEVMGDLGVDKGELMNSVDVMNVARQKKMAPQVVLSFSPANPVDGERVTVSATPTYFMNSDPKNLYFTWYLQRGQCVPDGESWDQIDMPITGSNAACNLDGDDSITVNDYKIAAARIIANGGWAWNRTHALGPDDSLPYTVGETDETGLGDGFEAPMGGSDQKGKNEAGNPDMPAYCYVHDWVSGNEYELDWCEHLFPEDGNIPGELGDGEFHMEEEQYWHTDPTNQDTAGIGRPDEANALGLGINEFSWTYQTGDRVGVAIEGISMESTIHDDSSYKTMWALPKNTCDLGEFLGEWDYENGTTTFCLTEAGEVPYVEGEDCAPFSEETDTAYINNPSPPAAPPGGITDTDTTIPSDGSSGPTNWADTSTIRVEGTSPIAGGETMGLSSYLLPTFSVSRDTGAVAHPDNSIIYGNTTTVTKLVTEDVTMIEAQLTANVCTTTETTTTVTDVLGYQIGDATTETEGPVCEEAEANVFDMSKESLNACLVDNLMTPSDVQQDGSKIKLSLYSTPQSPMNDPKNIGEIESTADTLVVTASAQNVNDENFLRYDWEVYGGDSDSIVTDDWGEPFAKEMLIDSTQTSGIGVKSLKFKLAFADEPKYLKVQVVATEYEAGTTNRVLRKGNESTIIRLSSASDTITAYNGVLSDDGVSLAFGNAASLEAANVICANSAEPELKEDYVLCPVVKDQIIGLKYAGAATSFLWTINNQPVTYKECFFEGCDLEEQTASTFFPILDEPGSIYTVTLSAVDSVTGEKINLTRSFKVVTPLVKIVTLDDSGGAQPVFLGTYTSLDGTTTYADMSQTDFQTVPGSTANFTREFYPRSLPAEYLDPDNPEKTKTAWFVDGTDPTIPETEKPPGYTPATVDPDKTSVSFATTRLEGEYHLVAFNTLYAPSTNIKKILNANWDINYDQFYEKQLGASIDVEMVPALTTANSNNSPPKKVLAAMISGLPAYINFLFRIVMTSLLLLFGIWIVLSLFPSPITNETEPR